MRKKVGRKYETLIEISLGLHIVGVTGVTESDMWYL